MSINPLSAEEKRILLILARQTIECVVNRKAPPKIDLSTFTSALQENGASFVTLTKSGNLRGCIGALEAYQPLVQDVCEHAAASALEDYRFPPVQPKEVDLIKIEISHLSIPKPVTYQNVEDLLRMIEPGQDGIIVRDQTRRATFLPQVWQKIPSKEDFLSQLCLKMGATADLWQKKSLQVSIYRVEEFIES